MASNAQSKLLQEAAQRYAQQITPETLVALAERGISELVAGAYQIGTIVEPINGHEMYEGWISIPYITVNGSCVGFKFRRLDDGKPKYGSPTGQKAHLYNVNDITISSKHIVITEGELVMKPYMLLAIMMLKRMALTQEQSSLSVSQTR